MITLYIISCSSIITTLQISTIRCYSIILITFYCPIYSIICTTIFLISIIYITLRWTINTSTIALEFASSHMFITLCLTCCSCITHTCHINTCSITNTCTSTFDSISFKIYTCIFIPSILITWGSYRYTSLWICNTIL